MSTTRMILLSFPYKVTPHSRSQSIIQRGNVGCVSIRLFCSGRWFHSSGIVFPAWEQENFELERKKKNPRVAQAVPARRTSRHMTKILRTSVNIRRSTLIQYWDSDGSNHPELQILLFPLKKKKVRTNFQENDEMMIRFSALTTNVQGRKNWYFFLQGQNKTGRG